MTRIPIEAIEQTEESIEYAIAEQLRSVNTSFPGIVTKVDATKYTIEVKSGVKFFFEQKNAYENITIVDVPLLFPSTSTYLITLPVNVGDKVLLVISQKSIEEFITSGKDAINTDQRVFDASDAVAIPGFNTWDNLPSSFSQTSLDIRNKANTQFIKIKSDNTIDLKATTVNIEGNVNITGGLNATNTIVSNTNVIADGINLKNHVHGGVQSGGSNTTGPI